jgi:hypothetical protein
MFPHDGVGSMIPSPRIDRADSLRMYEGMLSVAETIT